MRNKINLVIAFILTIAISWILDCCGAKIVAYFCFNYHLTWLQATGVWIALWMTGVNHLTVNGRNN